MKLFAPASIGLCFSLLVAGVQPVAAQIADATRTWTLQESVDYAMQHNISIKQQDVQRRFAMLTLKQSQLSEVPSLSVGADGGYSLGRSVDPTTNQFVSQNYFSTGLSGSLGANIFNWFNVRNTIKANRLETQANDFLLEKAKNDVALNIAQAFLQILLNDEQVHISENQLKLTQFQLENTRKQVVAGAVPESNQADLEAQLARDSSTLVSAQTTAIVSVIQMKALLNLGFDQSYTPQVPGNVADITLPHLTELSPEMVYSAAQATYPLIQADNKRVEEYDRLKKAAFGALFPSLSLQASAGTNYSELGKTQDVTGASYKALGTSRANTGDTIFTLLPTPNFGDPYTVRFGNQVSENFRQYVGLHLNIPILNGWQLRTNYNKAKLNLENQQLATALDNQRLRQDIYTAYSNAVGSLQKYNASSRAVEAAQRAFDFAGKRYELGLMNTIDYITTQSNLFRAKIDKVSALYDYVFKMKLLEFYRDQHISL